MCGIAGAIEAGRSADSWRGVLRGMADALRHRGPDDEGAFFDAASGVGLAHRRLAVLDLSPEGKQPMASPTGRYVIVFNGEVYNFRELRAELGDGIRWRGSSDTEVMLAAFERWGVVEATRKFVGMFAFALWDRRERALWLVRDRLGVKPLYYGWSGGAFLFGSELKALRAHPAFSADLDRGALVSYFRRNYVPAPGTIWKGIRKLEPGTAARIPAERGGDPSALSIERYWSMRGAVENGLAAPFRGTYDDAVVEVEARILESVQLRLVSDVPLGAFLSGGIDSSLVVAAMRRAEAGPVKTFTIGFAEADHDESAHAEAIARHLGTEHTCVVLSPEDVLDAVPRLPALYDEPFGDSSQVPTFLVSEVARRSVTVSLSGDGGDEFFGGYPRYGLAGGLWRALRPLPPPLRRALAAAVRAIPAGIWDGPFGFLAPLASKYGNRGKVSDKAGKLAEILGHREWIDLYTDLLSHWKRPFELVEGGEESEPRILPAEGWPDLPGLLSRMMYLDAVTYLPDDILVKVDRASMAVSLESREPLLDHRLVELSWTLAEKWKRPRGEGKKLLRSVLARHAPPALFERPKRGFGMPIGTWLRGPLRDWAESLLDEKRLRSEGILRPEPIRTKWEEHLSGKRDWQYYLWDVLVFQGWREGG